jgi:hypothetical protein
LLHSWGCKSHWEATPIWWGPQVIAIKKGKLCLVAWRSRSFVRKPQTKLGSFSLSTPHEISTTLSFRMVFHSFPEGILNFSKKRSHSDDPKPVPWFRSRQVGGCLFTNAAGAVHWTSSLGKSGGDAAETVNLRCVIRQGSVDQPDYGYTMGSTSPIITIMTCFGVTLRNRGPKELQNQFANLHGGDVSHRLVVPGYIIWVCLEIWYPKISWNAQVHHNFPICSQFTIWWVNQSPFSDIHIFVECCHFVAGYCLSDGWHADLFRWMPIFKPCRLRTRAENPKLAWHAVGCSMQFFFIRVTMAAN